MHVSGPFQTGFYLQLLLEWSKFLQAFQESLMRPLSLDKNWLLYGTANQLTLEERRLFQLEACDQQNQNLFGAADHYGTSLML
jgi:hypothetical protein